MTIELNDPEASDQTAASLDVQLAHMKDGSNNQKPSINVDDQEALTDTVDKRVEHDGAESIVGQVVNEDYLKDDNSGLQPTFHNINDCGNEKSDSVNDVVMHSEPLVVATEPMTVDHPDNQYLQSQSDFEMTCFTIPQGTAINDSTQYSLNGDIPLATLLGPSQASAGTATYSPSLLVPAKEYSKLMAMAAASNGSSMLRISLVPSTELQPARFEPIAESALHEADDPNSAFYYRFPSEGVFAASPTSTAPLDDEALYSKELKLVSIEQIWAVTGKKSLNIFLKNTETSALYQSEWMAAYQVAWNASLRTFVCLIHDKLIVPAAAHTRDYAKKVCSHIQQHAKLTGKAAKKRMIPFERHLAETIGFHNSATHPVSTYLNFDQIDQSLNAIEGLTIIDGEGCFDCMVFRQIKENGGKKNNVPSKDHFCKTAAVIAPFNPFKIQKVNYGSKYFPVVYDESTVASIPQLPVEPQPVLEDLSLFTGEQPLLPIKEAEDDTMVDFNHRMPDNLTIDQPFVFYGSSDEIVQDELLKRVSLIWNKRLNVFICEIHHAIVGVYGTSSLLNSVTLRVNNIIGHFKHHGLECDEKVKIHLRSFLKSSGGELCKIMMDYVSDPVERLKPIDGVEMLKGFYCSICGSCAKTEKAVASLCRRKHSSAPLVHTSFIQNTAILDSRYVPVKSNKKLEGMLFNVERDIKSRMSRSGPRKLKPLHGGLIDQLVQSAQKPIRTLAVKPNARNLAQEFVKNEEDAPPAEHQHSSAHSMLVDEDEMDRDQDELDADEVDDPVMALGRHLSLLRKTNALPDAHHSEDALGEEDYDEIDERQRPSRTLKNELKRRTSVRYYCKKQTEDLVDDEDLNKYHLLWNRKLCSFICILHSEFLGVKCYPGQAHYGEPRFCRTKSEFLSNVLQHFDTFHPLSSDEREALKGYVRSYYEKVAIPDISQFISMSKISDALPPIEGLPIYEGWYCDDCRKGSLNKSSHFCSKTQDLVDFDEAKLQSFHNGSNAGLFPVNYAVVDTTEFVDEFVRMVNYKNTHKDRQALNKEVYRKETASALVENDVLDGAGLIWNSELGICICKDHGYTVGEAVKRRNKRATPDERVGLVLGHLKFSHRLKNINASGVEDYLIHLYTEFEAKGRADLELYFRESIGPLPPVEGLRVYSGWICTACQNVTYQPPLIHYCPKHHCKLDLTYSQFQRMTPDGNIFAIDVDVDFDQAASSIKNSSLDSKKRSYYQAIETIEEEDPEDPVESWEVTEDSQVLNLYRKDKLSDLVEDSALSKYRLLWQRRFGFFVCKDHGVPVGLFHSYGSEPEPSITKEDKIVSVINHFMGHHNMSRKHATKLRRVVSEYLTADLNEETMLYLSKPLVNLPMIEGLPFDKGFRCINCGACSSDKDLTHQLCRQNHIESFPILNGSMQKLDIKGKWIISTNISYAQVSQLKMAMNVLNSEFEKARPVTQRVTSKKKLLDCKAEKLKTESSEREYKRKKITKPKPLPTKALVDLQLTEEESNDENAVKAQPLMQAKKPVKRRQTRNSLAAHILDHDAMENKAVSVPEERNQVTAKEDEREEQKQPDPIVEDPLPFANEVPIHDACQEDNINEGLAVQAYRKAEYSDIVEDCMLDQFSLIWNEKIQVFICKEHSQIVGAILPSGDISKKHTKEEKLQSVFKHLTKKHFISQSREGEIKHLLHQFIPKGKQWTFDRLTMWSALRMEPVPPIEGLAIVDGWQCQVCGECSNYKSLIRAKCSKSHRKLKQDQGIGHSLSNGNGDGDLSMLDLLDEYDKYERIQVQWLDGRGSKFIRVDENADNPVPAITYCSVDGTIANSIVVVDNAAVPRDRTASSQMALSESGGVEQTDNVNDDEFLFSGGANVTTFSFA